MTKVSKATEPAAPADDASSDDGHSNGPFSGSPRCISTGNNTIVGHKVIQVRYLEPSQLPNRHCPPSSELAV